MTLHSDHSIVLGPRFCPRSTCSKPASNTIATSLAVRVFHIPLGRRLLSGPVLPTPHAAARLNLLARSHGVVYNGAPFNGALYIMVHHLMVRYIVSIRHFLTVYSVNKIHFLTHIVSIKHFLTLYIVNKTAGRAGARRSASARPA